MGVGPTGMMHVLLAKSADFSKIFCLDLNDFRLDFAKKFGVTTIRSDDNTFSETILDSTEKRGVDRCVLKLINAYEYGIYSDSESDDFKKPKSNYEERQATGSQQDYVYKLLNHTAFTVGKGAEFKADIQDSIVDVFDSAVDTSELISDLKVLKEQFIENQKKHIVK